MSHKLDDKPSKNETSSFIIYIHIRFFLKRRCTIRLIAQISFDNRPSRKKPGFPSVEKNLDGDASSSSTIFHRVEEETPPREINPIASARINFRGIIDQGFECEGDGCVSGMTAAPRPNNKLEKSITCGCMGEGKGGRTLHCHVIGDGVTVLDAFLIVRYVSTLRRARVACAHAFMHRIITRR